MGFFDFLSNKNKPVGKSVGLVEDSFDVKMSDLEKRPGYVPFWGDSSKKPSRLVEDSFDVKMADLEKRNNGYSRNEIKPDEIEGDTLKKVYNCNIKSGVYVVPKKVEVIDIYAFCGCDNLEKVVFHENVKFISPYAFYDCKSLREYTGLENNKVMKSFGGFTNCESLEKAYIPYGVELISDSAFMGCTGLHSVMIPEGCWAISPHAFEGCTRLNILQLPSTISMVHNSAFHGCDDLTITFSDKHQKPQEEYLDEYDDEIYYEIFDPDFMDNTEDIFSDENKIPFSVPYQNMVIEYGAFNGAKGITSYQSSTIEKVINSGYKGTVTYLDKKGKSAISVDVSELERQVLEETGKEKE